MRYGFAEDAWHAARLEAEGHLLACARERRTTTYGELASAVCAVALRHYSFAMTAMLSEACRGIDERIGGIVSASLVVRKDTGMPGEGYFTWAARGGADLRDRRGWWQDQLHRVFESVR